MFLIKVPLHLEKRVAYINPMHVCAIIEPTQGKGIYSEVYSIHCDKPLNVAMEPQDLANLISIHLKNPRQEVPK